MIITGNVLEEIQKLEDFSYDILLSDPPYNLSATYDIDKEGHYCLRKKSKDFMGSWDNFDGRDWNLFFNHAFRILKWGSPCILFSLDRQQDVLSYYARKNGFDIVQSLYWVFISSFPKASDMGKMLEKNINREKYFDFKKWLVTNIKNSNIGIKEGIEKCGFDFTHYYRTDIDGQHTLPTKEKYDILKKVYNISDDFDDIVESNIEKIGYEEKEVRPDSSQNVLPIVGRELKKERISDVAKKYSSYKYSIAPLKQICETILVFRKPVLNSPVDDLLAYEKGNEKVYPVCVNIDGTRVPTADDLAKNYNSVRKSDDEMGERIGKMGFRQGKDSVCEAPEANGRYTPQLIIQEEVAESMDEMSGISKSTGGNSFNPNAYHGGFTNYKLKGVDPGFGDEGGMSKVFPKIKYYDDIDVPYYYCPKVNKKERELGCEKLEKNRVARLNAMGNNPPDNIDPVSERFTSEPSSNNHPTVKPIQLITWLLKLFCAPDKEKINVLVPFSGSGSELVACELTGVKYKGIEINPEYVKIAESRLQKAKENPQSFLELFKDKQIIEDFEEEETPKKTLF